MSSSESPVSEKSVSETDSSQEEEGVVISDDLKMKALSPDDLDVLIAGEVVRGADGSFGVVTGTRGGDERVRAYFGGGSRVEEIPAENLTLVRGMRPASGPFWIDPAFARALFEEGFKIDLASSKPGDVRFWMMTGAQEDVLKSLYYRYPAQGQMSNRHSEAVFGGLYEEDGEDPREIKNPSTEEARQYIEAALGTKSFGGVGRASVLLNPRIEARELLEEDAGAGRPEVGHLVMNERGQVGVVTKRPPEEVEAIIVSMGGAGEDRVAVQSLRALFDVNFEEGLWVEASVAGALFEGGYEVDLFGSSAGSINFSTRSERGGGLFCRMTYDYPVNVGAAYAFTGEERHGVSCLYGWHRGQAEEDPSLEAASKEEAESYIARVFERAASAEEKASVEEGRDRRAQGETGGKPAGPLGLLNVEIPVVVDPNGEVHSHLNLTAEGEDNTDVALLEEEWHNRTDVPIALLYVSAQVDLDAVFGGRNVQGQARLETVYEGEGSGGDE